MVVSQIFAPVVLFFLCFFIEDEVYRGAVIVSFFVTLFVGFIALTPFLELGGWWVLLGFISYNFSFTQLFYFTIIYFLFRFARSRARFWALIYLVPPIFLVSLFLVEYFQNESDINSQKDKLYSLQKNELREIPKYVVVDGRPVVERREFFTADEVQYLIEIQKDGRFFQYSRMDGNKVSDLSIVDNLPDRYLLLKTGKNSLFGSDYRDEHGELAAKNLYAYEMRFVDGDREEFIDAEAKTDWFRVLVPPSISNRYTFVKMRGFRKSGEREALRKLIKRVFEQGT